MSDSINENDLIADVSVDTEPEAPEGPDFAQIIGEAQDINDTLYEEREAEIRRQDEEDKRTQEEAEERLQAARRERSAKGEGEYKGWRVRIKRFSLDKPDDVDEIEKIMTGALTGEYMLRGPERYSKDDMFLTMSWLEPGEELRRKRELKKQGAEQQRREHTNPATNKPYLIQPPYSAPVPSGVHPGDGVDDPTKI